ncbi:winged helix-turn-helix transcriptional regulator [Actinospica durhamensis]|uniref:Winged helix-turn-helix transcriptional regulator n=1 Tax=Actinospica durhamensis TaxID=1508375 RepID=A0A941EW40_9ACTN|nr:winged helix-turn-helix domain-containing protein [Actinospica durhamensis]MBR7835009.1 winged helix-turn-helix transcriptional regulator [Actinospica durhamensis]
MTKAPAAMHTAEPAEPAEPVAPKAWHSIHKTLADPLRIKLLEALWEEPRSARELADRLGMPADRLYYHLGQLERAGLIRVGEYRPRGRGKVERVYTAVEVEPPGDAGPEETAAFLGAVLEATTVELSTAYQAKAAGRRREVTVHRSALRLTEPALAELRGHIERLGTQCAQDEAEGTWARFVVALVDLEDRPQ